MKSIIYSFGTFDLLPRSPVFLLLSHCSPSLSILPDQHLLPSVFTVRICLVQTANLPFFLLAAGTEGNRMNVWHFLHRRKSEWGNCTSREEGICGSCVREVEKIRGGNIHFRSLELQSANVASVALTDFKWTGGPSLLCYPKQKPYFHLPILGGTWDSDM